MEASKDSNADKQPLQVLHAVAAGQIQENHCENHLDVQPSLAAGNLDVLTDRRRQRAAVHQVQIQRQTRQRCQARARALHLILQQFSFCGTVGGPAK